MSKRLKIAAILFILVFPSAVYVFLTAGKEKAFVRMPYYGPKKPIRINEKGKEKVDTIFYHIPEFKFYNQQGQTVTNHSLLNKVWVASFTTINGKDARSYEFEDSNGLASGCIAFYAKDAPAIAVMMNRMEERTNLDTGLRLVTFTLDSQSVKSMQDYAAMIHTTSTRRIFLSGNKEQLNQLASDGFYKPVDTSYANGFIHFFLIDKEGCIRGIYNGLRLKEIDNLIDDINMLEAAYYIQNEKLHKDEHDKDAI